MTQEQKKQLPLSHAIVKIVKDNEPMEAAIKIEPLLRQVDTNDKRRAIIHFALQVSEMKGQVDAAELIAGRTEAIIKNSNMCIDMFLIELPTVKDKGEKQ